MYKLQSDFCTGTVNAHHELAAKAVKSVSLTLWFYMVPFAPAPVQ